jgi:VWFA-related protein
VAQVLAQIQPDERVAIFTLGNTLRTLHGFTSDRASLPATLARYRGEVPSLSSPEDIDDLFGDSAAPPFQAFADTRRVTLTLETLAKLANHVKGVPGRKNLLWVSGSFPMVSGMPDMEQFFKLSPNSSPFKYLKTFGEEMDRTVRALNAANVAVYPIDSRGLSTNPKAAINQGAMITLEGLRFDLRFKREARASALRIGVVDERGRGAGSLSIPLPVVR